MRAYHFTKAKHALDNLRQRRLKIATFHDLNDPFELWPVAQPNSALRKAMRGWKRDITKKYGVLCFSKNWHNPLLWSHYGERHHGIALGFDIHPTIVKDVRYVHRRPPLQKPDTPTLHTLLYTKHHDWRYERECRIFTTLDDPDPATRLYFGPFNCKLVLREVIAGALCTITQEEICDVLRDKNVRLTKARLAFNTFSIVKDRRGFRTKQRGSRNSR